MRRKITYQLLTFYTTSDAMAMEKLCVKEKIPGRLIPLPTEISAGCGLAWRILPDDFHCVEKYLQGDWKGDTTECILAAGNYSIKIEHIVTLEL
jgi:hypothetical protein